MSNLPAKISLYAKRITKAELPEQIIKIELDITRDSAAELAMRSGIRAREAERPWAEIRAMARWRLGQLLSEEWRSRPGPTKDTFQPGTHFRDTLKNIGLSVGAAFRAQQIGCLPFEELHKAFAASTKAGTLTTLAELRRLARPFWLKFARRAKHRAIRDAAERAPPIEGLGGPFALIYADPPWTFETWSEDGKTRSADQHYPTLSGEELRSFKVAGRKVATIAAEDAVLFMWCTSSNVDLAIVVMAHWGFEYKTHAVWDKEVIGTGYIFRNQHELLLYGSRGPPPMPIEQPSSVMRFKRGRHSAKPPEIRALLERMYPEFDARTRIEMFARGSHDGWTVTGLEGPLT
jgi:N6-adenosine-specific RNA methylase IME4